MQQSKMAQMGEMLSMIAHQWRQPLSAISASGSAINLKAKLGKLDKDTAIELSNKIQGYTQHLSNTIEDFRDFFKENKEKQTTTLEAVVKSTLNIVETSLANQNIKVITAFTCNKELETYPSELKQVVLNIIKNAEDILLEKKVENPTITIETTCKEKSKTIAIKDNGGGIPEDIKEKIFEPYFSTKLEKDGTGLGLYMSKTIIEKHCGGELHVDNDSEGAVFAIMLKQEENQCKL